jgi:hypothetical protein
MSAKITLKNAYILVEPQSIDYWELIEALGRLFKMPEYLEMNTIWDFPDDRINATYEQLYKIRDFIADYFPKGSKQDNKTAIVVKTGLQDSMADSYTKIVEDLPFEASVFPDLKSAEDWIVQN